MGSMSLSPTNRDVVLADKTGLFVIDLENPYALPRFIGHRTTWDVADIQWNPHLARSEWIASTSNEKLVVWNLNHSSTNAPAAPPVVKAYSGIELGPTLRPPTMRMDSQDQIPTAAHVNAAGARPSAVEHWLSAHTRAITDINWSYIHPEVLASCSVDTWACVWDLRAPQKPVQWYSAWNASMSQVKFCKGVSHRLAVSCDNKVLVWDQRNGAAPLASIEAHRGKIYGLDWSPYPGTKLDNFVTCSLDGTVKYWNLMSETSLDAIGEGALITKPEKTLETDYPIWRAKHLPFGRGIMTVAQRGDTVPSLWAQDQLDAPVARFQGHKDSVKEFLVRSRGTERQLLTWSRDQTLRIWPISSSVIEAVGGDPASVESDMLPSLRGTSTAQYDGHKDAEYLRRGQDRPQARSAPTSALFNPVAWMAAVQLRDESEDSPHGTLRTEVLRASQRWPLALEAVDVAALTCTVAAYGPWLDDGSTHAFLRASLNFPPDYPQHGPHIRLERNRNIPEAQSATIQQGLSDIAKQCESSHSPCLERCIAYMVQSPGSDTKSARRKNTPPTRRTQMPRPALGASFCGNTLVSFAHAGAQGRHTPHSNRFLYSYDEVIDNVLALSARAKDTHGSMLPLDIDMLANTSVLFPPPKRDVPPRVSIRTLPNSTFATDPP